MRGRTRIAGTAVALLCAASAAAQTPAPKQAGAPKAAAAVSWASLAGEWEGRSMTMKDSVITTTLTTFTADKKVTIKLASRPAMEARVLAMAGDSVTLEMGPYESVTRPGHKTTVTSTTHVADGKMTGTFTAKFDDGTSTQGKIEETRKMK